MKMAAETAGTTMGGGVSEAMAGVSGSGSAAVSGLADAGALLADATGAAGAPTAPSTGTAPGAATPSDDALDAGLERYDYRNDVAPILMQYCVGCHMPGGKGPFPLDTYEAVKTAAAPAAAAISTGIMPPCEREGERYCGPDEAQRAIFFEWVRGSQPLDLKQAME